MLGFAKCGCSFKIVADCINCELIHCPFPSSMLP
jgi:hypothetical protein